MILIVFSLIPGFYIVRKVFKRTSEELEISFIKIILGFSIIPPLMALLNNFFTRDVLFSVFLLLYGVIFAIITYKNINLE